MKWSLSAIVVMGWLCMSFVHAQDRNPSSAVETAAALEKAVVEVVEQTQASVVAIARVRKDVAPSSNPERFDEQPGFFLQPSRTLETDPTHPDFLPQEYGTGVVIDRGGLIVTTYHVLADPRKNDYYVWSQKRPFKATVLAADPWLDLAVLKVEASDLAPIKLGDAKQVKKGQFVIALGNPYGIARDGEVSAAWGVVSNLNRAAPVAKERANSSAGRETLHHYGSLLQTDARLERGTSGGALVNLQGELVGLITALTPQYDVETSAGFAIPVDQAFKDAIEKLKTGRKVEYGFLGVAPKHLSLEERQLGQRGAKVAGVVNNTPAADLDLIPAPSNEERLGDIITHVDGEEVRDADHLILLLSRLPAGHSVRLTVQRASANSATAKTLQKQVALAKKFMNGSRPVYASVADPVWRGLTVDYSTAVSDPNLSTSFLSHRMSKECVGVAQVERNSPAWKAGLRPGMFISHLGTTPVATPAAFNEAAGQVMGSVTLRLTEEINGSSVVTLPP